MFRCGSPGNSRPWRGFPIRTPWDHSPVIDSPRLIADSYVLLRLLMPRHPPCALKNLTTKDQKNAFRENHENHHPTPKDGTTDPGSYSWKLLLIKDARVHYVVLKQQPQTTHPTHNPQREPTCMIGAARKPETNKTRQNKPATQKVTTRPPALLPQDPTVCQTLNHPNHTPPFQDTRTSKKNRTSVLEEA